MLVKMLLLVPESEYTKIIEEAVASSAIVELI